MMTLAEKAQANRMLGEHGLATLNDPRGLFQQLAFAIENHEQFRKLLFGKVPPEDRRACYESLKPYLRFEAKALDVYEAEAKDEAERRQLPLIAPGGALVPFRPGEIASDEYIANRAIMAERVRHKLTLVCRKCTKEGEFWGERKIDAIYAAREQGWTYDESKGSGREICPGCMARIQ